MAKRLVLGSVVVAGLGVVSTWSQAPVAAFWARPPVAEQAPPPVKNEANNLPQFGPDLPEGRAWVEQDVRENGVIRTVMMAADAKTLREMYVGHHQRLADKLTIEQLAEKCNALKRESIGLSPEGEIEQMQMQLDQLKRKHQGDKGISARIQSAIEALKKQPSAESKLP